MASRRRSLESLQPPPFGPSVVIARPRNDPAAAKDEAADPQAALAQAEQAPEPETTEREEFIPAKLLAGLLPEALLLPAGGTRGARATRTCA